MKYACAAMLLFVSGVVAQEPAVGRSLCLKPQPMPQCRTVLLTTAGVHGITGTAEPDGSPIRGIVDWGVLFNVDRHSGVGVTWLLSLDRDGVVTGPMARYRYWKNDATSFDVGIGLPVHGTNDHYAPVFGLLKWNPSPNVGIALRPELRRTTDYLCTGPPLYECTPSSRSSFAVSAGIELSGVPGLTLTGLAAAGFAALVALYASVVD